MGAADKLRPALAIMRPHERPAAFIEDVRDEAARIDRLCGAARWRDGWVYAVRQVRGSRLIKIGLAREDVVKRLTDIQAMNASRLELVGLAHGAELEGELHGLYADYRAHNEWFALDKNPIPQASLTACFGCGNKVVR